MKKNAFSLIEVLVAIILIGLAIASLLVANSSFTEANGVGTNLSTAQFLIEQIKERTAMVDYGGLYAFDDASYSPPKDSDGEDLNDFAAFTQQITVENVNPADFEQVEADHSTDFVRITVRVLFNFEEISSTSWIRARY